jgi:hypothetical protein
MIVRIPSAIVIISAASDAYGAQKAKDLGTWQESSGIELLGPDKREAEMVRGTYRGRNAHYWAPPHGSVRAACPH